MCTPVRMLGLAVPGGIENLLSSVPRDGSPANPADLAAIAVKFGARIVGPPLPLEHPATDCAASPQPAAPSY